MQLSASTRTAGAQQEVGTNTRVPSHPQNVRPGKKTENSPEVGLQERVGTLQVKHQTQRQVAPAPRKDTSAGRRGRGVGAGIA